MESINGLIALGAISARALSYQYSTAIPGARLNATSVDQSTIYNGTYYLTDGTNKGVHVVDLVSNKQITVNAGFQGVSMINATTPNIGASGPNGLVTLPNRKELYVGDRSGVVKVVDLTTNSIVASITLNSTNRADEMAYDPETSSVACKMPNDVPPRVAIISAVNRTVNGYVIFNNTSGLEKPVWNATDKNLYISVPSTGANLGGEVAIVDINGFNVKNVFPIPQCVPAGIAFGSNQQLFINCSEQQILSYNISNSFVIDDTTGNLIANISGVSEVDQAIYNPNAGYYSAAAYHNHAGGTSTGTPQPQLAVINAKMNTLLQTITTHNVIAHSVAVDPTTNSVIVPMLKGGIVVYDLSNSTAGSGSGSSASSRVGKTAIHTIAYTGLALFAAMIIF